MARREAVDRDSFLPLRHQIGHIGLSWVEHSSPHQKWCCCVFLLSETHTSRENFAGRCHVQAHAQWYHARGEGNGTPLQFSCLANPMDGGGWWAAVHGVAKSQTRLSDFIFTFNFSLSCIGEGNGNPLQCSCLENPRDGGAWWAALCGVAWGHMESDATGAT